MRKGQSLLIRPPAPDTSRYFVQPKFGTQRDRDADGSFATLTRTV